MTFNGRYMSRVPTWTELRLDATKLAELQRECYRSVHDMLDIDIPELDRKLSILSNKKPQETKLAEVERPKPKPKPKATNHVEKQAKIVEKKKEEPMRAGKSSRPNLFDAERPEHVLESTRPITNGNATKVVQIEKSTSPIDDYVASKFDTKIRKKLNIVEPTAFEDSEADETKLLLNRTLITRSLDPNNYEHLKPLPMPLSYYLKVNRPDMIRDADRRVSYLRKKVERRKLAATERTINALDQIRISSRTSNRRSTSSLRSSMVRTMSRDSMPPSYQVKYTFSEQEMKRLTAKIYNRLPEVKKQRNQEVNKHLKVQNYKNKLDYGRKLAENRRRGIIDYPLKSDCYQSSVMSSQEDESLTNSLDRSADGIRFENYY